MYKRVYKTDILKWRIVAWVAIIITLLISTYAIVKIRNFITDSHLAEQQHQYRSTLEGILSGMKEAESAQRGFLLTNNPDLYKPFYEAKEKTYSNFEKARNLSAGDAYEAAMLDSMKALLDERFTLLEQVTRLDSISRRETDLKQRMIFEGYNTTEALHSIFNEMVAHGEDRLAQSQRESQKSGLETTLIIIAFSLVAILLLIFSFQRIFKELKERKRIEEELLQSERLLAEAEQLSLSGGFLLNVESGRFHWSEGIYHIFGLTEKEEPSIEEFLSYVHPQDKENVIKAISKSRKDREPFEIQFRIFKSDDGTLKYVKAVAHLAEETDNNMPGLIGSIQDITEEANTREELLKLNEELKRSNEELERFAYVASHDLQEPLRKILAFGDRLQAKFPEEAELPGREYVERMQKAASRMQNLIDDLLAFSRVSRDQSVHEEINLNHVLQEALDDLSIVIREKNAQIDADVLPEIKANKTQMHQLFQNLISNGIKFSKADKEPRIRIYWKSASGWEVREKYNAKALASAHYACIFVEDNGIGFDPKYSERIFNIFQRLHGRSEVAGTGIGLAVCKRIVENHGGFIRGDSKPNAGALFTVILPIHGSPNETASSSHSDR